MPQPPQHPWRPEHLLTPTQAADIIARNHPELAPVHAEPLAHGWDATAYLVNNEYVFRFTRRARGAECLRNEIALLPWLSQQHLPIPVPNIEFNGEEPYEHWPYAGHRILEGEPAANLALGGLEREALAPQLGAFLHDLHIIPTREARARGAHERRDLAKLDIPTRRARSRRDLAHLEAAGVLDNPGALRRALDAAPANYTPAHDTLVHGDLDARHILLGANNRPTGVIDFGDAHIGDAAVDLALAHTFLPPAQHDAFLRAYGPVAPSQWRAARFRALHVALRIADYALHANNPHLLTEYLTTLRFIAAAN